MHGRGCDLGLYAAVKEYAATQCYVLRGDAVRVHNATLIQDAREYLDALRVAISHRLAGLGKLHLVEEYVHWKVCENFETMYALPVENHYRFWDFEKDLSNIDNEWPLLPKLFYHIVRAPLLDWDTSTRIMIVGRDIYIHYYREKRL